MNKAQTSSLSQRRRENDLTNAIDELINIAAFFEQEDIKGMMKRQEELRQYIKSQIVADDQQEVTLRGTRGEIVFTPCVQERQIANKKRLLKVLGRPLFDDLAQFTLKSVKQYLNEEQMGTVTTLFYGSRKIKEIRHAR